MLQAFILFMIFMNFLIAEISNSHAKVTEFQMGHDYKQKANLIYELEMQLTEEDLSNETFFPNILVVRKKKENLSTGKNKNLSN